MKKYFLLLITVFAFISYSANAQFKNYGIKGGIQYQQLLPFSEFDARYSFLARGFINFELSNTLSLDLGVGYGQYKTDDHFNTYPPTSPGEISHEANVRCAPVALPSVRGGSGSARG